MLTLVRVTSHFLSSAHIIRDLWFPTSQVQSGYEKGLSGGCWCQNPFSGYWLPGLRASTDSAAMQP